VLAGILASLALASPAFAGTPSPAQQNALLPASKTMQRFHSRSVPTRAELEDFAQAVVAIGSVKQAAQPGISSASTPAERARLERAATAQIKAAIRSHHLSERRYLQIIAFIDDHPATQHQVIALMKQLPIPPPPPYQPLH
jgi:hypothetical protein